MNGGLPSSLLQVCWGDGRLFQLLGIGQLVGHLAQALVDLLLELAYAAFSGIVLDDVLNGCLVEAYLRGRYLSRPVFSNSLRHQVALGYLYLLLGDVAAYLDELHSVEQRTWNDADVVGGGNEEHLREIVVHIEIIVVEGVVLLWVEYFEQSRCWVSVGGCLLTPCLSRRG